MIRSKLLCAKVIVKIISLSGKIFPIFLIWWEITTKSTWADALIKGIFEYNIIALAIWKVPLKVECSYFLKSLDDGTYSTS